MGLKKMLRKLFRKDDEPVKEAEEALAAEECRDNKLFPCPVCGSLTIEEPRQYEICSVCGWEDDPVQRRDPDLEGGANKMSLNRAKDAYAKGEKIR